MELTELMRYEIVISQKEEQMDQGIIEFLVLTSVTLGINTHKYKVKIL